ncbi:MAG: hypothetical protein V3V08_13275 [Nannocystaceae bacterium]
MNLEDKKYAPFGLVADMMATSELISGYDVSEAEQLGTIVAGVGRLFLTGEGSSRIFPAKHAITQARRYGDRLPLHTEAGLQARGYDLRDWAVVAASNSGRTSEVVGLLRALREWHHPHLYSLAAFADSPLEACATRGFVLRCGKESAVAATKSVVEQALFCQMLVARAARRACDPEPLRSLGEVFGRTLGLPIEPGIVEKLAKAQTIYFAGKNDGVAEELTLKTNEIARKRSDFLEGTYAVHGIEEVMSDSDVVVWVDPDAESEQKFSEVLAKGVGLTVVAISDHDTIFPTIRVPSHSMSSYVMLAAGWNLLVEVGVMLGVDIDRPTRARKVGNEVLG